MTDSTWSLRGRLALVTGGSRGIGLAVVEELRALGADVIAVAREAPPGGIAADVTTAEGRARIVDAIRERGALHVLVHNAGTNVRGPLTSYDDATIARLLDLNLTSPLLLSRDLHPYLRAAGAASVIHVGSVGGAAGKAFDRHALAGVAESGGRVARRDAADRHVRDVGAGVHPQRVTDVADRGVPGVRARRADAGSGGTRGGHEEGGQDDQPAVHLRHLFAS